MHFMRRAKNPAKRGFDRYDKRRLAKALHAMDDARTYRRVQAVLLVALLWLPKQCPELNPQDHLWRELKRLIVANRQFPSLDQEAQKAERWFLGLSPATARRKAGILSGNFWLKEFM